MSAQIRVNYTHEVRRYSSNDGWDFYVRDENTPYSFEDGKWSYLGHAGIYFPIMDQNQYYPYIVSPNAAAGAPFPQVHVETLAQVMRFYEAYAETVLARSAIEAERAEWAATMLAAEAAEVRARELLNPHGDIPPVFAEPPF